MFEPAEKAILQRPFNAWTGTLVRGTYVNRYGVEGLEPELEPTTAAFFYGSIEMICPTCGKWTWPKVRGGCVTCSECRQGFSVGVILWSLTQQTKALRTPWDWTIPRNDLDRDGRPGF